MRPSEIFNQKRAEIRSLAENNPKIVDIYVFGSVARGEDTEESDIDFIVSISDDCTLYDLSLFSTQLQQLVSTKIDLVTVDGVRERFLHHIQDEWIRV